MNLIQVRNESRPVQSKHGKDRSFPDIETTHQTPAGLGWLWDVGKRVTKSKEVLWMIKILDASRFSIKRGIINYMYYKTMMK